MPGVVVGLPTGATGSDSSVAMMAGPTPLHSRVHAGRVRPRAAAAEADDADFEREAEAVVDEERPATVSLTRIDSAGQIAGAEHRALHEVAAVGVHAGLVRENRDRRLAKDI